MASPKKTEPTTAIVTANLPDFDATATEVAVKPRALIVVSDGSEEMEVLTLSDLLTLGGMHVTLAALGRKRTNVVQGCFGLRINADQSIEESSFGTFELIVLPGGTGAERYLECELLKKMLQWHVEDGRWVAASSTAPARVLRPLGLLESGAQVTCSTDCARLISDCYVDANVVVSGHCVTSQGPGTAMELGLTLIKLICDEQEARKVAREVCYDWE